MLERVLDMVGCPLGQRGAASTPGKWSCRLTRCGLPSASAQRLPGETPSRGPGAACLTSCGSPRARAWPRPSPASAPTSGRPPLLPPQARARAGHGGVHHAGHADARAGGAAARRGAHRLQPQPGHVGGCVRADELVPCTGRVAVCRKRGGAGGRLPGPAACNQHLEGAALPAARPLPSTPVLHALAPAQSTTPRSARRAPTPTGWPRSRRCRTAA